MVYQKNRFSVWLFAQLVKFSTWLQASTNKMIPPPFRLVQIGSAFWQSRLLYVAARLDIATVLADKCLHVDEIARRISAQPDATFRLLRMLSALGIFEMSEPRKFSNNKFSRCLCEGDPQNIRPMILMHNSPQMSRPWFETLEQGITSGAVPFELIHNKALFDYLETHPEFSSLFSTAMDSVEALSGDSFATDFDWRRFDRIFDVGGSKGSKSLAILKRHPHLNAQVIDQTQLVNEGKTWWQDKEDEALLARLSFQSGDVLASVPVASSKRDIYLLSAVLHGFDDETAIKALQNIAQAIGNTGARIALLEMVVEESQADVTSCTFDMQMFMGTRGRERTLPEWEVVFTQAGLRLEEAVKLRPFGHLLVLQV